MDKVSIFVATYKEESRKYLDLCMESIRKLNYSNIEVILIHHKDIAYNYEGVKYAAPPLDHFYNATGMNYAIKQSSPDSKYYLLLNDDVILTPNSLTALVRSVGDAEVMANPISPCDNYTNYNLVFGFKHDGNFKVLTKNHYILDEVREYINDMMVADSVYPIGSVIVPMLCMYCTLIPKKVWDKVGTFDEKFKIGQDDLDYSIRASLKGVKMIAALNSLVWHFGGVTAKSTVTAEMRKENLIYFKEKWGCYPPGAPPNILELIDEQYGTTEIPREA